MSGLRSHSAIRHLAAWMLAVTITGAPLSASLAQPIREAAPLATQSANDADLDADDASDWMHAFDAELPPRLHAWWQQVRAQAQEAPLVLTALSLQARGERVEPPFAESRVISLYLLAAVMLAGGVLVFRGRLAGAAAWLGLAGGPALGAASGLWALAGAVMLVGVAFPVLLPALRVLLRRADHTERAPPPPTRLTSGRSAAQPTSSPASNALTTSREPAARPRPPAMPSAPAVSRQQLDALLHLVMDVMQAQLRRLRPKHVLVGIVLLVIAPVLFVLALGAAALVLGYRHGIAYAAAEWLLRDETLKARVLSRLPRPASRNP